MSSKSTLVSAGSLTDLASRRLAASSDLPLERSELDVVFPTAGPGNVVAGLHPQESVHRHAEHLLDPQRHFRREVGPLVEQRGQRRARDPERPRSPGHRQVERLDDLALGPVDPEGDPPVPRDRQAPYVPAVAREPVRPPARYRQQLWVSQTGCGAAVQPDAASTITHSPPAAPERKPVFTNQLPQRIGDDLRIFVLLRLILRPGEPFGEGPIRDRLPQRPAKRVELSNLALRQAPFIDRAVMSIRIGIPEPCRNDSRREDYGISCRLHPEPVRQVPDPA